MCFDGTYDGEECREAMAKATILVVVAHPDDEILGCGGTINRMADSGAKVVVLVLSSAGRYSEDTEGRRGIKEEMEKAGSIIGISCFDTNKYLPDQQFDTRPHVEIVGNIERAIQRHRPSIVFTHHHGDVNKDHQIVHECVLTATRPRVGNPVKKVFAFEVPSSTEYTQYDRLTAFVPNVFFALTDINIQKKLDAMEAYQSELQFPPYTRSLKYIEALATVRGNQVGAMYAEAFQLVRAIV